MRGGENSDYGVGERMTKLTEETIFVFFQLSLFELDTFLPHRECFSFFFMLTEAQQD